MDETVDESLPVATGSPRPAPDAADKAGAPETEPQETEPEAAEPDAPKEPKEPKEPEEPGKPEEPKEPKEPKKPAGPATLGTGRFITHEHGTTGTVRILRLEDGSLVLRLENLDTSNGPDLRVWLTDAPVIEGRDGWHVFDDGAYVSAGKLKGNKGSQNYPLPADTVLEDFNSVSIWCARFNVSFGAADITWA